MIAVGLVHAGILLAVLNLGGVSIGERDPEQPIQAFDVLDPLPPPPPVTEQVPEEPAQREQGAASPPNLESQATPVVVPPPRVELPRPTPIVASETPAQGAQATQGAAPVPGPGTGAGGAGVGTGGGGSGLGPGSGGGGGTRPATRAQVIASTQLVGRRDFPREIQRAWARRGPVFTAVRVQPDGRATECKVNRSSGDPLIDQWTCRLIEQKVRFRPATDEQGRPVVSWYGYVQEPI